MKIFIKDLREKEHFDSMLIFVVIAVYFHLLVLLKILKNIFGQLLIANASFTAFIALVIALNNANDSKYQIKKGVSVKKAKVYNTGF